MVVLSSCYMEPDRTFDDNTGLPVGTGGQQFDTVITPTPSTTATPTPAPTNQAGQSDWADWDFSTDTATNPPSNVIPLDSTSPALTVNPLGGATATPAPSASTGTPSSDTLKSGSEGAAVKQLQTKLKELGYYTGSVDGKYGAGTVSAVKAFQAANNLTADGVAGKATQEAVYSYYAIAKKDAPNNAATAKPSGSSTATAKPSGSATSSSYTNGKTDIYLKLGSSGAQVKILQNRLIVLGYLSGTADGDFQETTEAAVIAFQKRNSIYADGIAGPSTLSKLYSSSAKKASSVAANIGSLKRGMNGSAVKSLQQQLKTLGYYTGSTDGDFGAGTEAAVIAFQSSNNLTPDGIAGKGTMNAIYAATGSGGGGGGGGGGGTNAESYGAKASINGYTTISGSSGTSKTNITTLQGVLNSRNYYSGELDGSYGSGTSAAVSAYQRDAGLRVTGVAGPATQRLLYNETRESGSYSKLEPGSSGSAVKNLQYTLYEMNYYDGSISGKYDEATKNAVMLFQQVNGLTVDGIAGQDTQRRLYSSNAIPCR